jgi:pimeloyl-ACP methyl ester carboxylesterase
MKTFLLRAFGVYVNILAFLAPKYAQRFIFDTFSTPNAPKLQSKQIQYLRRAHNGYIYLGDNKIQTYRWGTGNRKVLLVHGWASSSYRWRTLIKKLVEKDFSVYALDAPAHGLSEGKHFNVHYYEECLNVFQKKIGDIYAVVGHSVGAFTLMYHMHENGSLEHAKTVLLASPGETSDFVLGMKKMLGLSSKSVDLLNTEALKRVGRSIEYYSAKRFYPALKGPLLIIHDADDIAVDVIHSDRLAQWLVNAEYQRTSGLGHHLRSSMIDGKIIDFIG